MSPTAADMFPSKVYTPTVTMGRSTDNCPRQHFTGCHLRSEIQGVVINLTFAHCRYHSTLYLQVWWLEKETATRTLSQMGKNRRQVCSIRVCDSTPVNHTLFMRLIARCACARSECVTVHLSIIPC